MHRDSWPNSAIGPVCATSSARGAAWFLDSPNARPSVNAHEYWRSLHGRILLPIARTPLNKFGSPCRLKVVTYASVSLAILGSCAAPAYEFEVRGTVHYSVYGAGHGTVREDTIPFRVAVSNGCWAIHVVPRSDFLDYADETFDGNCHYLLCSFVNAAAKANAGQVAGQAPPAPPNTLVLTYDPFPAADARTGTPFLWLAFCSKHRFARAGANLPRFYAPDFRRGTDVVKAAATMNGDAAGLPRVISFESYATAVSNGPSARGRAAVYQATRYAETNGLTIPLLFSLKEFVDIRGNEPDLYYKFEGEVTNYSTQCPGLSFVPVSPGPFQAIDQRFSFSSLESPVLYQTNRLLSTGEASATGGYAQARRQAALLAEWKTEQQRLRRSRPIVLVVFGTLALTSVLLLARSRRKRSEQTPTNNN